MTLRWTHGGMRLVDSLGRAVFSLYQAAGELRILSACPASLAAWHGRVDAIPCERSRSVELLKGYMARLTGKLAKAS